MEEFSIEVDVDENSWNKLLDALNDDSDLFVVGNWFSVEKGGKKAKYVCESVEDANG